MAARPAAPVPPQGPALTVGLDRHGPGGSGPARADLRPLPRRFFARPSTEVAPDLLGRLVVRRLPRGLVVGRIVETEAYQEGDPASHSYRGRTLRTEVMFGPPGHLYVYFTYGMHFCMNVVTGADGEGSAVLLRAAEPLEGLDLMRELRRIDDPRRLCAGPARLTQALAVDRSLNGADVVGGSEVTIGAGRRIAGDRVDSSPRIGIRTGVDRPWRFFDRSSPFVSRGSPAR